MSQMTSAAHQLHEAIALGDVSIATLLLNAGADAYAADALGTTPAALAQATDRPELLGALQIDKLDHSTTVANSPQPSRTNTQSPAAPHHRNPQK